jgi:hypothetical protein
MGEGRPVMGLVGNKPNAARPEVIRSFLVTIPPDQELGIAIADRAIRLGCLKSYAVRSRTEPSKCDRVQSRGAGQRER